MTKIQPTTGEHDGHLFAPFTVRDLTVEPFPIDRRDEVRVPALLDDLSQRCEDEHRNHAHPFCPVCRGDDAELVRMAVEEHHVDPVEIKQSAAKAEMSLRRWLALNPGRNLPEVDDAMPEEESTVRKAYLSYDDLAEFPEPTWLIPGWIPDQSVGYLMGRDGTYKTFLALHMTMTLLSQGQRVLFVAGEGVRSFRKRIDAWLEHNGVEMTERMKADLDIRGQTVDLFEGGADYLEMVKRSEDRGYALIVVDTLARSSGAAEQNSNSDMNLITQRIDRLKHVSGATVLVVAHTDKGDNGIRGASAIGDNGDFRLLMKRKDDEVVLSIDKMKDADDDLTKRLAIKAVGESIVLIPAEDAPTTEPVEGSHTVRNRILVALASLVHLGYVPASQVVATMADDASGLDFNRGSVYRDLSKLVGDGTVLKHETTKSYLINCESEVGARYLAARP